MTDRTPVFATLDKVNAEDPVEGHGTQFQIEFRDEAGKLLERINGTRSSCFDEAAKRGIPFGAVRVTGRAEL